MNIKRAKEEIEHTVKAYLAKDALGEYAIPSIRQRPILLMGPPGIGKTQIMEQAARECGVALVAYTITHHTRQSAVGLPGVGVRLRCVATDEEYFYPSSKMSVNSVNRLCFPTDIDFTPGEWEAIIGSQYTPTYHLYKKERYGYLTFTVV